MRRAFAGKNSSTIDRKRGETFLEQGLRIFLEKIDQIFFRY